MAKTVNTRIKQKTDTASAWATAGDNGFVPLKGEIIHYSDSNKMKVGDGETNVSSLEFTDARRSSAVYDYNNAANPIYVGYQGSSLSSCTYLAAYGTYNGATCIKDISPSSVTVGAATNATNLKDSAGSYTYTTLKAAIDGKQDAGSYVTIANAQTVTGTKTFSAPASFTGKVIGAKAIGISSSGSYVSYDAGSCTTLIESSGVTTNALKTGVIKSSSSGANELTVPTGTSGGTNTLALTSDVPTNLENGSATGSAQMKADPNSVTGGKFSFTGKNANATTLDSTLTGDIAFGATEQYASSFGGKSQASGKRSFACGTTTIAKGKYSFASGDNSVALGDDSHAEGYSTVTGPKASAAHSEGYNTQALGHSSHSEGNCTKAGGDQSHAEGVRTSAAGGMSHAEGVDAEAGADNSHVEGNSTATKTALPTSSGSSGSSGGSTSNPDDTSWNIDEHRGVSSHAEGVGSTTYGYASHAEGFKSVAYGHLSHAEGDKTATGTSAGSNGWAAHAEGQLTVAKGNFSHAGGVMSSANGTCSFAHGSGVVANGDYSAAFGLNTTAAAGQFVCGRENVASANARFIVGNAGRNAFEVLNDGRAKVQSAPTESNDVVRKQDIGDQVTFSYGNGTLTITSK